MSESIFHCVLEFFFDFVFKNSLTSLSYQILSFLNWSNNLVNFSLIDFGSLTVPFLSFTYLPISTHNASVVFPLSPPNEVSFSLVSSFPKYLEDFFVSNSIKKKFQLWMRLRHLTMMTHSNWFKQKELV